MGIAEGVRATRQTARDKRAALIVFFVALAVPFVFLSLVARYSFAVGAMAGVFSALVLSLFALAKTPKGEKDGMVRVRDGVLEHEGEILANRSEVVDGYVFWSEARAHVRLRRRDGGEIALQFDKLDDARALLEALEIDASHRAARFPIASPSERHSNFRRAAIFASIPITLAVAGTLTAALHSLVFATFGFLPLVLSIVAAFTWGNVHVGADGVLVTWLWQRRFIPLREIESAEVGVSDAHPSVLVRVRFVDGKPPLEIIAADSKKDALGAKERARAIVERIEEARALAIETPSPEEAGRVLAREGREARTWLADLHERFDRTEGFRRGPPLTTEQLLRVVEDRAARPTIRAAAAAALSRSLDEKARTRVRIAAESTAAPKLRVALEAAANEDDAMLASALADVEDTPTRSSD